MGNSFANLRAVYVVAGRRTPFLKAKGPRGAFSASDLAVEAGRQLLMAMPFSPEALDEVVIGSVFPDATEANIARVISLRLGCGKKVPAYSVNRNCASGMQALDCAAKDIAMGRAEMVLAGGTEAMSRYPLLHTPEMVEWLVAWGKARSFGARLGVLGKMRPAYLKPVLGVLQGLTDHVVGLNMGETAEILAHRFSVSREEMDAFSVESHRRLAAATDEKRFDGEMTPLIDAAGNVYDYDDGLRRDSDMEKMAKLKPVFDRKIGKVTAGNSAQLTDGAAALLLASGAAVKKYNLPVLGKLLDFEWAGVDPAQMGLGPVHAMAGVMVRNGLKTSDIGNLEINEAFATQVMACLRAWNDGSYMKNEIGDAAAGLGPLDMKNINVDGGGVSIGHPVGASGARLVLHLLNTLRRNGGRKGIASLCIGGGQGGAVLVENVERADG